MKCSLIVPNTRYESDMLWSVLPSAGLLSIASCLKEAGHPAQYIDADFENLTDHAVIQRFSHFCPDVVGITMNSFQANAGLRLAGVIKERFPGIKVVVGGPHPSALKKDVLETCSHVDIVCVGESEQTAVELLDCLESGDDLSRIAGISYKDNGTFVDNPDRAYIQDLDALPRPAYELVNCLAQYPGASPIRKSPMMHVMASRGCPYQCIFCTKCVWGSNVRFRTPKNVVDEIEYLHQHYGINEIFFQDDTMNLKRDWFFEICDEIVRRSLHQSMCFRTPFRVNKKLLDEDLLQKAKASGFWLIFYGVESGNQQVLDTIQKGTTINEIKRAFHLTRQAGISTIAAFMVGNIGDTEQTIRESVELAKFIRPDNFGFSIATPLPGTKFHEIAAANDWIENFDYANWSQFKAVCRNEHLTAEQITTLRDAAEKEVRSFLQERKGNEALSMTFKDRVKKVPLIGSTAVSVYRALKGMAGQRKGNSFNESVASMEDGKKDYSQMDVGQIQTEMDSRYSQGEAYPAEKLWDVVRDRDRKEKCCRMIQPTDDLKILEIGCGNLGAASYVERCQEFIGTDLSHEAIETVSEKFGHRPGFSFRVMDAQGLDFDDGRFDFVIAEETLEHVSDIERTLREAYRVLKPGGHVLITSPNRDSVHLRMNRYLGYDDFTCSSDHITELAFGEMADLMNRIGFDIVETDGVFLTPYWGIPGVDGPVRQFTDDHPEVVELFRQLGSRCGAEYAFVYIIKALKPAD